MADFDCYKELQVSRDATPDEIRAAFRRLAIQYHPDRNPGDKSAEQKFKRIAEAYDVLSDPQKRAAYDRGGVEKVRAEKGFRTFESVDDIVSSFGDIFGDLFGGRVRREASAHPGQNYETEIHLSAAEAAAGGRHDFTIDEETACGACGGSGTAGGRNPECPTCGGRGVVSRRANRFGGFFSVPNTCPECGGRGASDRICPRCGGEGVHAGPRAVELTVPRGIKDGTVLRLRGMGAPSAWGGSPGDLLVRVRVADDAPPQPPATKVTVDLVTAVLGGTVRVPIGNGAVDMKVPAGTQPGQIFRIRDANRESLVTVDVEIPRELTVRQRKLLEEFRRAGS